jgi:hypothetical protein
MRTVARLCCVFLACSLFSGCGGDDDGGTSGGPAGTPVTVVVIPARARIVVGQLRQFTARGEDRNGRPVAVTPVWSVSPENLGRIDEDGVFVANCIIDTGVVKASVNAAGLKLTGTSLDTLVESSGGTPVALDVEPDTVTVEAGGSFAQLYVIAVDPGGTPVAVQPVWDVLPEHLGTVNELGLFLSGDAPGVGELRASVGDLTAGVFLQVIVTDKR